METETIHRKKRILVVDDHPLVLAGLSNLINKHSDLMCCATAATIAAARKSFATCEPDLVTIDLGMPDGDCVQLIKELAEEQPATPILVISQCDETVYAERVLKVGARGYVTKERCTEEVVTAIRAILQGELYVSQKIAALALRQLAGRRSNGAKNSVESLTNRELQVLQMLGTGVGTRNISAKLNLSIKTVETHRENIKRKLAIADAAGLVHFATNWVDSQSLRPKSGQ